MNVDELEAQLEAHKYILSALLMYLPELDFAYIRNLIDDRQKGLGRPLPPLDGPVLNQAESILLTAETARHALRVGAQISWPESR